MQPLSGPCSALLLYDWDIDRQEIMGAKKPSAITGEIRRGVDSGAKRSRDRNDLDLAVSTRNVEFRPLQLATTISQGRHGGFVIDCDEVDETGDVLNSERYATKRVFLGAGCRASKLVVEAKWRKILQKPQ